MDVLDLFGYLLQAWLMFHIVPVSIFVIGVVAFVAWLLGRRK
jgi:hypothetical protein